MGSKICANPTWVDLKGKDSIPDTVHHCVLRVDLERHWNQFYGRGTLKQPAVVLDGVHNNPNRLSREDEKSFKLKELKQRILIQIIDKFQVSYHHLVSD